MTQEDSSLDLKHSESHNRKTPEEIQQMIQRMQPKLVNVANGSLSGIGTNKSRVRKPAMLNGIENSSN